MLAAPTLMMKLKLSRVPKPKWQFVPLSQRIWHLVPLPRPGESQRGPITSSLLQETPQGCQNFKADGGGTEERGSHRQNKARGTELWDLEGLAGGGVALEGGRDYGCWEQAVVHAAFCPSGASSWAYQMSQELGGQPQALSLETWEESVPFCLGLQRIRVGDPAPPR